MSHFQFKAVINGNNGEGVDYTPHTAIELNCDADISLDSLCESFNIFAQAAGYHMAPTERITVHDSAVKPATDDTAIRMIIDRLGDLLNDPEAQYDPAFTKMDTSALARMHKLLCDAQENLDEWNAVPF